MAQISAKFPYRDKSDISDEELNCLDIGRGYLKNALAFERNFEFIVSNYIDYENTIARISVNEMAHIPFDRVQLNKYITEINVRLINLLSTFRAYIDKSSRLVAKLSQEKKLFEELCNSKYDSFFSFRLIDLLRNHAQHSDDPMQILSSGGEWRGTHNTTQANLEYYTNPIIDTAILKGNNKIKKNILPEADGKFHLTFCIKQYIECLSCIHHQVSEKIKEKISAIDEEIQYILNAKFEQPDDKIFFVYKGDKYETYYLNFDTYYDLNKKHIGLKNLSNHCINTKTPEEEKDKIILLNKFSPKKVEEIQYFLTIKNNKGETSINSINIKKLPPSCMKEVNNLLNIETE